MHMHHVFYFQNKLTLKSSMFVTDVTIYDMNHAQLMPPKHEQLYSGTGYGEKWTRTNVWYAALQWYDSHTTKPISHLLSLNLLQLSSVVANNYSEAL
jgi:hypothetical protein